MFQPIVAATPPKTNGLILLIGAVVCLGVGWLNPVGARRALANSDADPRLRQQARLRKYIWGYGVGGLLTLTLSVVGIVILITGR